MCASHLPACLRMECSIAALSQSCRLHITTLAGRCALSSASVSALFIAAFTHTDTSGSRHSAKEEDFNSLARQLRLPLQAVSCAGTSWAHFQRIACVDSSTKDTHQILHMLTSLVWAGMHHYSGDTSHCTHALGIRYPLHTQCTYIVTTIITIIVFTAAMSVTLAALHGPAGRAHRAQRVRNI